LIDAHFVLKIEGAIMNIRHCFTVVCTAALLTGATGIAAQADKSGTANVRDGLVKVKSHRLDAVYLLPGTDFRGYTKVLLDQTQVTFRDNWIKDVNRSTRELSSRISSEDAERIVEEARTTSAKDFSKAFKDAGFEIVTAPGADVLRLAPRVIDMYVNAPDKVTTAPLTRVFTVDAGEATLVLEIRDSTTGALLGRATDHGTASLTGSNRLKPTSSVLNRGEFEDLFRAWARACAKSLNELKAQPPLAMTGQPPKQ
jgi:hypothetical protein